MRISETRAWMIAAMALLILLAFCKKEDQDESRQKTLSPEVFFAAQIETDELNLEFKQKWVAILDKHGKITPEAHEELRKLSEDMKRRHEEIISKYDLGGPDWARRGPDKKARDEYLEKNPEVRNRMEEIRKSLYEISQEVNRYFPPGGPKKEQGTETKEAPAQP